MPLVDDKLTGKAGKVTFKGVDIPFTTTKPTFENNFKDATDSTNYSPVKKRLFASRRPGRAEFSSEVTFNFNPAKHQVQVLLELLQCLGAGDTVVYGDQDQSVILFKGKCWWTKGSFTVNVKEGEMLEGTATLESEDVFDYGA